jgi:hypothetical protein
MPIPADCTRFSELASRRTAVLHPSGHRCRGKNAWGGAHSRSRARPALARWMAARAISRADVRWRLRQPVGRGRGTPAACSHRRGRRASTGTVRNPGGAASIRPWMWAPSSSPLDGRLLVPARAVGIRFGLHAAAHRRADAQSRRELFPRSPGAQRARAGTAAPHTLNPALAALRDGRVGAPASRTQGSVPPIARRGVGPPVGCSART